MEGVLETPDSDEPHEMGDMSKEMTDEEMDKFDEKRSEAISIYSEGDWDKAVTAFTEAVKLNPNFAAMFAKRGTCFIKQNKPRACIRDCTRAIQLNPDNASAYKFRGRAHRLLGDFTAAAKDLRTAYKIDFDEQADEWLREVTLNAKKLEEHERKKAEEKELKERQERLRKAREARAAAAAAAKDEEDDDEMPGIGGRQVGQLWMLSEVTLKKECKKFSLSTEGHKHELIARLGKVIRSRERKMLTMGGEASKGSHDITPINKVDDEDLPQNMESMEREELQCVAASYGLDFDHSKDVKMDLVKKLTSARLKGTGLLMITDEGKEEEEVDDRDDDPEFKVGGNDSDSDY